MLPVTIIETTELGDRSYLVTAGDIALAIDPQRDIDRILDVLNTKGLSLVAIFETHIHNDYVSGGRALAQVTGCQYVVPVGDTLEFDAQRVADGDIMTVGPFTVRAIASPGHTEHHMAYLVNAPDQELALFSGGSLLYGSVGRTDLVEAAKTEQLTRLQYQSAHKIAESVPAATPLYPTHGFGSFCSAGNTSGATQSTLETELGHNDVFTAPDEAAFVKQLVAGLGDYPRYYAHMGVANRAGAQAPNLDQPRQLDGDTVAEAARNGKWVIDLRNRKAYSSRHLSGTVGIEMSQQVSTWVGWLLPWGSEIVLVGESMAQVGDAQRQLCRIGFDDTSVWEWDVDTLSDAETSEYECSDFAGLVQVGPGSVQVLDVRHQAEHAANHIPGARHIPLQDLLNRIDEVSNIPTWIHCRSGYRASIAASLLKRNGISSVTLIDDHFDTAVALGLTSTK